MVIKYRETINICQVSKDLRFTGVKMDLAEQTLSELKDLQLQLNKCKIMIENWKIAVIIHQLRTAINKINQLLFTIRTEE